MSFRKKSENKSYIVYKVKLKNRKPEYFNRLFLEAKWLSNSIISYDNIFSFDTKQKSVSVKVGEESEIRELQVISSQMKQQLLYQIQDDIKALAAKKQKGSKVGGLKFKRLVNVIPLSNQSFVVNGTKVRFQNCKTWFHCRGLHQLPENADIRSGQLVRRASGIYLHICVAVDKQESPVKIADIGLDFGIKDHFVFSNGSKVNFNADDEEKRVIKAHKNLSRKQKGSGNWHKAKLALNKEYERIDNIKRDATNKLISSLKHFNVVFQDEMLDKWQSGWFGKQVHKSILGRVKAALKNCTANLIDKSVATTKTCFECGKHNDVELSDRVYLCSCGYICDRDIHSARNMLKLSGLEQASVERELDLQRVLQSIQCKHLSVKQEATSLSWW